VTVATYSFTPADLTIKVGDTVIWTWTQGVHNVTGAPFGSGDKNSGDTYGFTFQAGGSYAYTCTIHPSLMQGTVTVQP
jgi:plastocyanin